MAIPVLAYPAAVGIAAVAAAAATHSGINTVELVTIILVAVFSSITAPLIIANRTQAARHAERLEDRAYQEKKDTETRKAAEQVAVKAATAARDLAASQKAIADQAAEAARLLLAANERVAKTSLITNGKLDVIHTLVNSNMTTAMKNQLDATRATLVMMLEVVAIKKAAGEEPAVETLAEIDATKAKITELESLLADRAAGQARADQMPGGVSGDDE